MRGDEDRGSDMEGFENITSSGLERCVGWRTIPFRSPVESLNLTFFRGGMICSSSWSFSLSHWIQMNKRYHGTQKKRK